MCARVDLRGEHNRMDYSRRVRASPACRFMTYRAPKRALV